MDNKEIDYKRSAEQLRKGEPLFGKDGALAPMLERILNAALEGEIDAHLSICLLYTSPSPRDRSDLVCRLLLEKKKDR